MAETEKNHIHRIIFEESGRQPVLSSIATLKKGLEDLNNVSKIKIELEDVNIVENFRKITSKIKSSPNLKISVPLEIQYSDSLKKLQTNLNQFLHSSKSEFDSLNPKIDLTLETLTNIRNLDFKNVNKHFYTLRNFSAGVADNFERISQSKLYQGQNPIVDLAINEVVSAANKTNLSSTLDISPLSAALDDQAQKIKASILGGTGQKNIGSQKDCCDVIEKLVTNSDHLLEILSYGFDQLLSGKIDLKTSNTGNAGTTTVSSEDVEKQKVAEEERLWEETAKLELKKMHLDDQQIDAALKNIKKYKTSNNQMLSLWDRLGKGLKNFVGIEDAVVRQTSKLYYIQLRNAELEKERGEKGSLGFFKTAELGIMTFLKKASPIGMGIDIAGGLVNKLAGAINPIFALILKILDYGAEANKRMFAASQGVSMAGGLTSKGPLTGQTISDFREQIAGTKNSAGQATPDNMFIRAKLGLSDEKLTSAYSGLSESSIDVSKSSGEMFDHFKDLSLQAGVLGKDIGELSRIFGEVMYTQNTSMNMTFKTFAKFTRQMKDSGLSANRFFGIVQSLNGSLGIYGTRLSDITEVMAKMSKYGMGNAEQQSKKSETLIQMVSQTTPSTTAALAQMIGGNTTEGGIEVMNNVISKMLSKLDQDLTSKYVELNREGKNQGLTPEQIELLRNENTRDSVTLTEEQQNKILPLLKSLDKTAAALRAGRTIYNDNGPNSIIRKASYINRDVSANLEIILKATLEKAFKDKSITSTADIETHLGKGDDVDQSLAILGSALGISAEEMFKKLSEIIPDMTAQGFEKLMSSPQGVTDLVDELRGTGETILSTSTTFSDAIDVFKQGVFSRSAGFIEDLKSTIKTGGIFAGISKLFKELPWGYVAKILGDGIGDAFAALFPTLAGATPEARKEARDTEKLNRETLPNILNPFGDAFGGKASSLQHEIGMLGSDSASDRTNAVTMSEYYLKSLPEYKSKTNKDDLNLELDKAREKYLEATRNLKTPEEKVQTQEYKDYRDLILTILRDVEAETLAAQEARGIHSTSSKAPGTITSPVSVLPKTDDYTPEELKLAEEQKRKDIPVDTGSSGTFESADSLINSLASSGITLTGKSSGGIQASEQEAKDSLEQIKKIAPKIYKAAKKRFDNILGMSPEELTIFMSSIASRESHGREDLPGDDGNARGAFQINVKQNPGYSDIVGKEDSDYYYDRALNFLSETVANLKKEHPDWTDEELKFGIRSAWNMGVSGVKTNPSTDSLATDKGTTGDDYANDTTVQFLYFLKKINEILPSLPEPVSTLPTISPFSTISAGIPTMGGGGTYAPSLTISPTINLHGVTDKNVAKEVIKALNASYNPLVRGASWFAKGR